MDNPPDPPPAVLPYAPRVQPTTHSRLRTAGQIIGCGFLGAMIALALTWVGFYFYDLAYPSHDSNENHAWTEFALVMMSPWPGFALGLIYGIVRARRRSEN